MKTIHILFPAFCHAWREPDPEFQREAAALESLGLSWHVVHIDALIAGDLDRAFRFLGNVAGKKLLYRGWILHPPEYERLFQEIASRGGTLVTSAQQYAQALLFPLFYEAIRENSFPATWIDGTNPARAWKQAQQLGPPPYFIKDYAKSAKELWPKGCLAYSRDELAEAILTLKKQRGDRFEGGIVIRPFVKLRYLEESPFGGPIYEEYRMFYFNGHRICLTAYDRHSGDPSKVPDYLNLATKLNVPFFSADVVVTEEGRHRLLEVGDGGCSGLPPALDAVRFYEEIAQLAGK